MKRIPYVKEEGEQSSRDDFLDDDGDVHEHDCDGGGDEGQVVRLIVEQEA